MCWENSSSIRKYSSLSGAEAAGLGAGGGKVRGLLVYCGEGDVVVGIGARVGIDLILILRLAHVV